MLARRHVELDAIGTGTRLDGFAVELQALALNVQADDGIPLGRDASTAGPQVHLDVDGLVGGEPRSLGRDFPAGGQGEGVGRHVEDRGIYDGVGKGLDFAGAGKRVSVGRLDHHHSLPCRDNLIGPFAFLVAGVEQVDEVLLVAGRHLRRFRFDDRMAVPRVRSRCRQLERRLARAEEVQRSAPMHGTDTIGAHPRLLV